MHHGSHRRGSRMLRLARNRQLLRNERDVEKCAVRRPRRDGDELKLTCRVLYLNGCPSAPRFSTDLERGQTARGLQQGLLRVYGDCDFLRPPFRLSLPGPLQQPEENAAHQLVENVANQPAQNTTEQDDDQKERLPRVATDFTEVDASCLFNIEETAVWADAFRQIIQNIF